MLSNQVQTFIINITYNVSGNGLSIVCIINSLWINNVLFESVKSSFIFTYLNWNSASCLLPYIGELFLKMIIMLHKSRWCIKDSRQFHRLHRQSTPTSHSTAQYIGWVLTATASFQSVGHFSFLFLFLWWTVSEMYVFQNSTRHTYRGNFEVRIKWW